MREIQYSIWCSKSTTPNHLKAIGCLLICIRQPIPPRQAASLNNMSCSYNSETELHPFAFRTHTHAMGRVVSAYVKHASDGSWQQIGKRNPQWPQLFQSSPNKVVIKKGDFMAATCRFDSSDKDVSTPMGSMGVDEMCNFYMMFYRDVNAADPFPYGAGCGMNEKPELVAKEYPMEGSTLLPAHPEWEHMAHQSGKPFGVVEKEKISSIGDEKLGQVSGLAFDNLGNIVVFHRGSRTWSYMTFTGDNVLQDKTPIATPTLLVEEWAEARIKSNWLLSMGKICSTCHTIQNDELTPVWELGTKFQPGSDRNHFCKPAGVAVSRADGTVRAVLAGVGSCFSTPEGRCSKFGSRLLLPSHDISLDERNSKVYVADRENGRVQVFNDQGDPMFEVRNPKLFESVYSAHFCDEHGLLFIPGSGSNNGQVDTNKNEINISFRPKSDQFRRPHIIRAKGNTVYVGEIDEAGGILWRLDIRQKRTQRQWKGLLLSPANQKIVEENWLTSILVMLLLVSGSYLVCYLFWKKCCGCYKNKSPQDGIDRTGFKPLKTLEAEDDSDLKVTKISPLLVPNQCEQELVLLLSSQILFVCLKML
uniref:peptidylamidoglycolate lyase n=1 Tax=Ditylenchus dipsaci TaxID=166011 RepID=A0A915DMI1_9BILA